MKLTDIIRRRQPKGPWVESDNIPWSDPDFSKRMLKEHLTQEHCMASRQFDNIDRHVEWINHTLLQSQPSRVLDLCCGPGLYSLRLAGLGHSCVGMDYSPASIEYATKQAKKAKLDCDFKQSDVRRTVYGKGYDLVMLTYGEFNVFKPKQAQKILNKAVKALAPGGWLLLEPQTYDAVKTQGTAKPSWYSTKSGLFTDNPHLCLQESFWHEELEAATVRFWVVDVNTGMLDRYAYSAKAYADDFFGGILWQMGMEDISVGPVPEEWSYDGSDDFILVRAQKPESGVK